MPALRPPARNHAGRRRHAASIRATLTPPARWRRNIMPRTGRASPAARSRRCAIIMSTAPACRATRLMPASLRSSPRRSNAAKRRKCSRTAACGAISSMCAMSPPRPCAPLKRIQKACGRSMSAPARRARSATWRRLWRKVCRVQSRSSPDNYRLGDVRHITADSSRLCNELGWAPKVNFADGMAELARL